MFKVIALMGVCVVCGVVSSPTVLSSNPVVVNAEPTDLSGFASLAEKSSPGIESQKLISSPSGSHVQSFSSLPGTRNNAERIQIEPVHFRGTENLAEKAIPEAVIARITKNHEKMTNRQQYK